jgi:hypothetical protein
MGKAFLAGRTGSRLSVLKAASRKAQNNPQGTEQKKQGTRGKGRKAQKPPKQKQKQEAAKRNKTTLCYAIVSPCRTSGFRETFQIRPSGRPLPLAGRRADFEIFPIRIRPKSGPETPISSQAISPPLVRSHFCSSNTEPCINGPASCMRGCSVAL